MQLTAGGSLVAISPEGLGSDTAPVEVSAGTLVADFSEPFGPYGLANQMNKIASWGRALGGSLIPHGTVFVSPYFVAAAPSGIPAGDRTAVLAGGYFDLTSAFTNAGIAAGAVQFLMNQRATASTTLPDFFLTYGRMNFRVVAARIDSPPQGCSNQHGMP